MRQRLLAVFLALMMVPAVGLAQGDAVSLVVQGSNTFALKLYQHLKGEGNNLFFSPYSISSALAMTYVGARGGTKEEMAKVLHLPSDVEVVGKGFLGMEKRLMEIAQKGLVELINANSLWVQRDYSLLDSFLGITKRYFQAEVHLVDFRGNTEGARQEINRWVEVKTKNRIRDLIGRGHLDSLTRLVLCNAIYFKGKWAVPFVEEATRKEEFWVSRNKSVQVDMMHLENNFKYVDLGVFKAIELFYGGGDVSMVIFLPRERDGLSLLEKRLTPKNIEGWLMLLTGMPEVEVKVSLPRFRFEEAVELSKVLAKMGMRSAFSGKADFSGITGQKDLCISKVIHKAFIDVNEEGTEAAGASAVVMRKAAVQVGWMNEPKVFRADHPFVFLIVDNHTGAILFMGRVVSPNG